LVKRSIRAKLIRWYEGVKRDLPWRRTREPYAIWISEIMLQQTRVAAVIPYYERFLARFPNPAALAEASEDDLLAMWSGLGYYSRARNLQKAARDVAARGTFPDSYDVLRALAGIGDYTAAAIASIAFDRPHAAVDGNVKRVIARLMNDGSMNFQKAADELLDRKDPGRWNQAMMELGATVCLPREPLCDQCPLARNCEALKHGSARDLPGKKIKPEAIHLSRTLVIVRRAGGVLLKPGARVKGFWDLPEGADFKKSDGLRLGAKLGEFRHTITHRNYRFTVQEARAERIPEGARWFFESEITAVPAKVPLSTTAKKAMRLAKDR